MAGVTINSEDELKLKELGVKDSKLLSRERRDKLFKQILGMVVHYKIISVTPDVIDETLRSDKTNLNKLEADTTAVILNELNPDKAIIDLPEKNAERYQNYIRENLDKKDLELVTEHKADYNYPVVAAASILAKVTRDRYVDFLKEKFGEDFGSGYMTDEKTQKFLKKHWNNSQVNFFRKEWASWKNMKIEKTQKKLGDF
jgi:ribonuclease HII